MRHDDAATDVPMHDDTVMYVLRYGDVVTESRALSLVSMEICTWVLSDPLIPVLFLSMWYYCMLYPAFPCTAYRCVVLHAH